MSTTTDDRGGAAIVRVATMSDIDEMHRVRLSVRENQLSDPARVQPHHYNEMLVRRGRGWVAEVGGRICGFAIVDLHQRDVWALFVEPRCEGRGLGSRLQQCMLEYTFAAGVERLSLTTNTETRAERFYSVSGWRLVERRPAGEARFEMTRDAWISRQVRQLP